jgi:hypothetical protein
VGKTKLTNICQQCVDIPCCRVYVDYMTSTQTACKYRKTKTGQWVVMGPCNMIKAGTTVTVTKADGTTKTEYIESVGKAFDGLCYGYPAAKAQSSRPRYSNQNNHRSNNSCEMCEDGMSFGMRGGATCPSCGGTVC